MADQYTPADDMAPLTEPQVAPDPESFIGATIKPPKRKEKLIKDKVKLVQDVIDNYKNDLYDRAEWAETRLQRYAKFRGWREIKTFPWEDASNAHLPIIMTDVLRTEDTLHNAVLSTRPVMNAKAMLKSFEEKEATIDQLIDTQVFVENQGESRIGNLIGSFCQDGQYIAYCPYIREKQKTTRTYLVDYPASGISWDQHILDTLHAYYPQATILPGKNAPWGYILRESHPMTGDILEFTVEVYQGEIGDKVQIVCHHNDPIFDGPAIIPLELEDVVVPSRSENLQPRTMANPMGAPRVVMVDYPSKDEIIRLKKSGFYDEMTQEDEDNLLGVTNDATQRTSTDPQAQKILKDDLAGTAPQSHSSPKDDDAEVAPINTVTRLTFFGRADLDGDGLEEEVVYWLLESPQILLRARYLTEVYPITPMRRPFSMAKYIPVNGQFYAIGLIEIMEAGYDIIKKTFDQMIDSGDITNTPFGFYRPMSGIRPEKIKLGPGDLYPTSNPKDDVFFPTLPQGMGAFGQNVITMVSQILDQATLVGQLQLGGVPTGKSSALRTTSNMQALLQQGDARPERVLRRFFTGLAEIWAQFHELNKIFLPMPKMFRMMKGINSKENPYVELTDKSQIQGRFMFDFTASILNTNKALAQGTLQELMAGLINPLMLQLGISTPETIYNLVKDWIKSKGQEPDKYSAVPQGADASGLPKISVADALLSISNGYFPYGAPMEPLEVHIQQLYEFVTNPENMKNFSPGQTKLLAQYVGTKVQEQQEIMKQQQLMQAAAEFQQSNQQPGQPGPQGAVNPPSQGPAGNPQTQKNELYDKSMPNAGGGAVQ